MSKKEPPLSKKLKKWAKQFTKDEWALLCVNKDFNDILLEDAALAADVAETILKRNIIPY